MVNKCRVIFAAAAVGLFGAYGSAVGATMYDYVFNVNGTTYCPPLSNNGCSNNGGTGAIPGAVSSINSNGVGTVSITFNPHLAGTYYINGWAASYLSVPAWNEYGVVNGSANTGQSYQIDVPDYESNGNHTGTIIANTMANTLDNTNHIPGTTDNYLLGCGASGGAAADATCNDSVSMATGYKFTLTSSQEAVVTFDFSTTNPGGFSLEQIHPVDGNNNSESDYFLSSTLTIESPCTGPNCGVVPEPASWPVVLTLGAVAVLVWRRFAKNSSRKAVD